MWLTNDAAAIRRWTRKLVREAPGPVRICYEAGPCGFALQRQILAVGPELVCDVIAPALIPVRPGERIKTDRRDARRLVRLYRSGELTVVHPPTEAEEALRDLMRCREDAREDLLRARHRLGKFLLRHGRLYAGKAWSDKHTAWLSKLRWDQEPEAKTFDDYRLAIEQVSCRLREMDRSIELLSQKEPYQERVGWLRCFRGIDTVTAMTILAELHGFERFRHPRELMSYLGLVPSERSSGDRTRRGALTKAGNAHVRRVLIESSHHARHRPHIGYQLRRRRREQPAWVIAHADRAMKRLNARYWRLLSRGKPHNKAVAAVAREFVGFVWAVLQEGRLRQISVQSPSTIQRTAA
jgi:transposase